MLISEKRRGRIKLFSRQKKLRAYPIVRQLERITAKKAQTKVVKCAKNKCWVPKNPSLRHLSVKIAKFELKVMVHSGYEKTPSCDHLGMLFVCLFVCWVVCLFVLFCFVCYFEMSVSKHATLKFIETFWLIFSTFTIKRIIKLRTKGILRSILKSSQNIVSLW